MQTQTDGIEPGPGDALLIVDAQIDFLPSGRLAVSAGDEIVPVLNAYLRAFGRRGLPVFATRDWHPPDHCSFREHGGPWPPHCVAHSDGARFAPLLDLPCGVTIISKATEARKDAYSGFEDTALDGILRAAGVRRLFVGGLATDYCVLNTVRDARRLGYAVRLLTDAIRAVDVQPGDGARAVAQMRALGAVDTTLDLIAA